jgi:hypothetical protein
MPNYQLDEIVQYSYFKCERIFHIVLSVTKVAINFFIFKKYMEENGEINFLFYLHVIVN